MPQPQRDNFSASFLGLACGDALGAWTENLTPSAIRGRFKGGLKGFPPMAHPYLIRNGTYLFTDDTQVSICVAQSLVSKAEFDSEDVSQRIVQWSYSPENFREPARTLMRASKLLQNRDPKSSGSGVPSTCGAAAARFVPLGLMYAGDEKSCVDTARELATLTHSDPRVEAAAAAIALIISKLIEGREPEETLEDVIGKVSGISESLAESLCMVKACSELDETAAFNCLGRGISISEILSIALYCFLSHPKDFKAAVLTAVNGGGKSDSIASLSGAFSGAHLGMDALPKDRKARGKRGNPGNSQKSI